MKSLYDDCIESFGGKVDILSKVESEKVMNKFQNIFAFTSYGRINWDSLVKKINIISISTILNQESIEKDDEIYIIWDDATFPLLSVTIGEAIKNIEEVLPVSFDTWFYCVSKKYVIEFYHEGQISLGKAIA
jgi:hypothetical protein